MAKTNTTKAFLIHRRIYKGNSLLVDFLTLDFGIMRCVAKGARNAKYGALQAFCCLDITFSGKSELKTLTNFAIDDKPRFFSGDILLIAVYVNELLTKLLLPLETHKELFYVYNDFVNRLALMTADDKQQQRWLLRMFEKNLLAELGYGLHYELDTNGNKIVANKYYSYQQQAGFLADNDGLISGELLLLLATNNLDIMPDKKQLLVCRNLFREQLSLLLGNKPLQSRILLQQSGR